MKRGTVVSPPFPQFSLAARPSAAVSSATCATSGPATHMPAPMRAHGAAVGVALLFFAVVSANAEFSDARALQGGYGDVCGGNQTLAPLGANGTCITCAEAGLAGGIFDGAQSNVSCVCVAPRVEVNAACVQPTPSPTPSITATPSPTPSRSGTPSATPSACANGGAIVLGNLTTNTTMTDENGTITYVPVTTRVPMCACGWAPLMNPANASEIQSCVRCANYTLAPLAGGYWSVPAQSCVCPQASQLNMSGTCAIPPSNSPTPSITPSNSRTPSVTPTNSRTPSITPSVTPTISVTPSITPTASVTPSTSRSNTPSPTPSSCANGGAIVLGNLTTNTTMTDENGTITYVPVTSRVPMCACGWAPLMNPANASEIQSCVRCSNYTLAPLVGGYWSLPAQSCVCPQASQVNMSGTCAIPPSNSPTPSITPSNSATPSVTPTPSRSGTPSSSPPVCYNGGSIVTANVVSNATVTDVNGTNTTVLITTRVPTCACGWAPLMNPANASEIQSCVTCANYALAPLAGGFWSLSSQSCVCPQASQVNMSGTCAIPPSNSPTPSVTATSSRTPSVTPSITPTASTTPSSTPTPSITPSNTPTVSVTPSVTPTISFTSTGTATLTPNFTASTTPSMSRTPSSTPTPSRTATPSSTPSSCANGGAIVLGNLTTNTTITDENGTISFVPVTSRVPMCACGWAPLMNPANASEIQSCVRCSNYTLAPLAGGYWSVPAQSCVCPQASQVNMSGTCAIPPSNSPTPTKTPTPSRTPSVTPSVTPTVSVSSTSTGTLTPNFTASVTPTTTPTPSITPTPACVPGRVIANGTLCDCAWAPVYYPFDPLAADGASNSSSSGSSTAQTNTSIASCVPCDSVGLVNGRWNATKAACDCSDPSILRVNVSGVCQVAPNATATPSQTPTRTPTRSGTPSRSPTRSPTPSVTPTVSVSSSVAPNCPAASSYVATDTGGECVCEYPYAPSINPQTLLLDMCLSCSDISALQGSVYSAQAETCVCPEGSEPDGGGTACVAPSPTPSPTSTPSLSPSQSATPVTASPTPSATPTGSTTRTTTPSPGSSLSSTSSRTPTSSGTPQPRPEVRASFTFANIANETAFTEPAMLRTLAAAIAAASNLTSAASVTVRRIIALDGRVLYLDPRFAADFARLRRLAAEALHVRVKGAQGADVARTLTGSSVWVDTLIVAPDAAGAAALGSALNSSPAALTSSVLSFLTAADSTNFAGATATVIVESAPSPTPSSSPSPSRTASATRAAGVGGAAASGDASSDASSMVPIIAGAAAGAVVIVAIGAIGYTILSRSNARLLKEAEAAEALRGGWGEGEGGEGEGDEGMGMGGYGGGAGGGAGGGGGPPPGIVNPMFAAQQQMQMQQPRAGGRRWAMHGEMGGGRPQESGAWSPPPQQLQQQYRGAVPQAGQFIINSPAAYDNGARWQMGGGGGPAHELEDPVTFQQPQGTRNGREVIGNAGQRAGRYSSPVVPVAQQLQGGGSSTRNIIGRGQGQSSMRNLVGATMGPSQGAVFTVRMMQQQGQVEAAEAAPEPDVLIAEEEYAYGGEGEDAR